MTVDRARLAAALPGYELRDDIGRGAWGTVIRAEHRQLQRSVAVKVLHEELALDPGVQARFGTEARILATLDHPHIVRIFDYIESGPLCLFVMELLPHGTLRDLLASEGITPEAACGLAVAASSALHFAHGSGVLHRDIKPENLMFSANGVLRVTDFGIAKLVGGSGAGLTRAGEVFGTAAYMAPEQAMSSSLGPATDVYALATVLYEMLAGRLPFPLDDNPVTTLYRHVNEAPAPLGATAPSLPPPIGDAVMAALAVDPAARPATAEDFGVRIADAAREAWGPGWLDRTGVEVVTSGRMAAHLSAPPQGLPAQRMIERPPRGAARRRPSRRVLVGAGAAAAVIAAVAIAIAARGGGSHTPTPNPSPSTVAATTATATAATPSASLNTGRLVFADDAMNDPTSGWAPDGGQDGNGSATFKPDGYHVTALKPNGTLQTFSVASPFALRLTSLIVSVDALMTGSPVDGMGVRCDQGAGRSGLRYTFEVKSNGNWVIFKIDEKGASTALAQGTSTAVHPAGQVNTIQGRCDEGAAGTRLTMSVNGTPLGTATDQHPPPALSWHAALIVYRDPSSASTDVRFTHVALRDGS